MGAPRCPKGSRWPTILLIAGAGVVSAFQVGKAPTALAAVQADLALGLPTASWLLSAFAMVGALAGIAIGVAVDHVGARRMALAGLLLQGLFAAAGAFAQGAPLLLATRAIEGLGFLTVTVAAPTLIVAVARPRDLGLAIAVWGTFMPVGIAVVLLGAPLLTAIGWRGFWLVNAAILVGYAGVLALGTRSVARSEAPRRSIAEDMRQTLAAGGPWLLAGLMAAFAAAFFAVFGFLPSLLSDRLAVGPETGALLTAVAMAANVLGNLGCGLLLARGVPRSHILLFGFAAMALCGFGILGESVSGTVAYALCVLFSAIGGLVPVALIDGAPRYAPRPELVGATVGFLMQGNNLGLVLGPAIAGALAAGFGWPAVSFVVAATGVAAGLVALALRPPPAEAALSQEPLPTAPIDTGGRRFGVRPLPVASRGQRLSSKGKAMAWTILVGAGLLEIVWAIALKHTGGFTRFWPSAIGVSAAIVSFFMLSAALKSLPVGTAYAVWVGIGALGESASPLRLGFLALILVGIVGLKLVEG